MLFASALQCFQNVNKIGKGYSNRFNRWYTLVIASYQIVG